MSSPSARAAGAPSPGILDLSFCLFNVLVLVIIVFSLHAGLKSYCDISVFMFTELPRGDNTFILASWSASLLSCHGNVVLLTD